MDVTPVRVRAARALVAIARRRRTLAAELELARRDVADERDRGLLLELTAGVCRWQGALDAVLAQCSRRPLDAIDAETLATLRLALYQLRHLDRVPVHAVVHAAVDSARALGGDRSAGFVNGVLRGYLRSVDAITLPPRPTPDQSRRRHLDYLSVTCSHPRWLVARWLDRYGFADTEAWCAFNNRPPEVSVRALDPDVSDTAAWLAARGIASGASPLVADMARLAPGVLGGLAPELRAALAVQDDGSALVADVVGAQPGDRVLDACAAPGGKSVRLWRAMRRTGLLVSTDLRLPRVHLLRQTLRAGGATPRIAVVDGRAPLPFRATFDRVLVDAPCSGLGTVRRDPDIKWRVALEDLPALAAAQGELLDHAATVVRPGGRLVYATCSSEPEENEAVVDAFLARTRGWRREAWTGPGTDHDGAMRTRPPRDDAEAFFAVRLTHDGA